MGKLSNFYRNVTFFDDYDENSFIGRWLDYGIWHDEEYWKLDEALTLISEIYPYPTDIPRDICAGILRITQLMMVPHWRDFEIESSQELHENSIFERFERLKYLLGAVFTGDVVEASRFDYKP